MQRAPADRVSMCCLGPAEGGAVRCRTDNAAVVSIVNTGRSKDTLAMHLMRCLSFFMARFAFVVRAEHVPGRDNGAADALSCDRLTLFRSQVSGVSGNTTPSGAAGHVSALTPGLDLAALELSVQCYFTKGLAPSTLRTYKSGQDRYLKFCRAAAMEPLPLVENRFCSLNDLSSNR